GFHRALRRRYDHLGPPLARWCRRNPWFADATYVLLKPAEWSAEWTRRVLGVSTHKVHRLYARRLSERGQSQLPFLRIRVIQQFLQPPSQFFWDASEPRCVDEANFDHVAQMSTVF